MDRKHVGKVLNQICIIENIKLIITPNNETFLGN